MVGIEKVPLLGRQVTLNRISTPGVRRLFVRDGREEENTRGCEFDRGLLLVQKPL